MRSSVVDSGRTPKMERPEDRKVPYSSQPYVTYSRPIPPLKKNVRNSFSEKDGAKKKALMALPVPEEGWLALVLLAVALYCVVFSIIAAKWVEQSNVLLYTPVVGLAVGVSIAKIPRLPQAILHLAACLLGYWFSVFLTSVVAFHANWILLLTGLRATLAGNISSLLPIESAMVFFFYLAFLCFFLGYFGGWLVYRARLPWLVALVYCSIMLVNLNYLDTNDNHRYLLVVMLGALLLLIARMHLVNQIAQWKHEGLHTDQAWMHAITNRFMRVASLLTVVAMLFSIVLPVQSQSTSGKGVWDRLDTVWNDLSQGRFSALNPGADLQAGQPGANFFSDHLTISGNVQLPTGEVLYYTSATSHYLQGFAYNTFDGHTWKTVPGSLQNQFYAAKQMIPPEVTNAPYNQINTTVVVEQPPEGTRNYIFVPAQPVNFSVDTLLYSQGNIVNIWTQASPLERGKSYTVSSDISNATPDMLAQTPLPRDDAAFWHQDQNYAQLASVDLQLPGDLSHEVYDLAKQWTLGTNDTYSSLRALESHLSDTNVFTYSTDNPPIPANQDVVDYLLHNRRGYCTYYATAMIMMARILNIPTRMVNGFSRGHYDLQRKVWSVDGSDAHSWVQAYFPGYGWIDFDPTPGYALHAVAPVVSKTPTVNPTKPAVNPQPSPTMPSVQVTPPATRNSQNLSHTTKPSSGQNFFNETFLLWLSVFLLLCSFLAFLAGLVARWWRNLYANSTFVAGTFWRLCWLASWVGLAPKGWQTPYEYSQMLSQHLSEDSKQLWRLTDLFVRDRWGPPHVAPHPQEEAAIEQSWPSLRKELVWKALLRRKK